MPNIMYNLISEEQMNWTNFWKKFLEKGCVSLSQSQWPHPSSLSTNRDPVRIISTKFEYLEMIIEGTDLYEPFSMVFLWDCPFESEITAWRMESSSLICGQLFPRAMKI